MNTKTRPHLLGKHRKRLALLFFVSIFAVSGLALADLDSISRQMFLDPPSELARPLEREHLFIAENLLFAVPKEHERGVGNGESEPSANGSPYHFAGDDCARCHVEGGKATNYIFTMAGTIYKDYDGTEPLADAEIILEDAKGKTISMISNEDGNFFTYEPMTTAYKAWMEYDDRVIPMVTVPTVRSHENWMSCNMHHYPESRRGALFIPTGATLPYYPGQDMSFRKHIQPILSTLCTTCHMPANARPSTSRTIEGQKLTYDYSGGLDLSSHEGITSFVAESDPLIDQENPSKSTLLSKMVNGAKHAGGTYLKTTDPDYQAILQWISEGAQDN